MATVEVFFTRFHERMPPSSWERWLAILPGAHRPSILRYRRWQDQHLHLLGKLLLLEGAAGRGCEGALESFRTDIDKRPFCDEPIDFNISHAGQIAVCAVAGGVRLGIDIEKVDAIDLGPYRSYMTADEWRRIEAAAHRFGAFFTYWTIKESVMKADGRGMNVPLEDIEVKDGFAMLDRRRWWSHTVAVHPDYVCHLATDRADIEVAVRELFFD